MDGILRRAARAKFRSLIDGQDAYEQIRIIPEHVPRSTVATPDGNMVSYVIQQGDCNAPATYQSLMNYLFSAYLGRFMDVYLDDIVVYSQTLDDHIKHVKSVLDILRREKLYLSQKKLQFLCSSLKILGRVIDSEGIRMDPDKVDALAKWKVPTNRDLLRGFLGAAGYLADDIDRVRIPMGILHTLTSDSVPWRWEETQQRAFDEIRDRAVSCKDHHRKPLTYGPDSPPVNMVTDGCITGLAGVISQGTDWKTATVAAFFSVKLSPAQQNYPVHEIELLAGIETMLRYRDILQGVKFRWFTDHKGLIHLVHQKNLSGRQARWMEKIGEFDFDVIYVPGAENILSDALSRIYSNDAKGTVRASEEYTAHDDTQRPTSTSVSAPVLVGPEAAAVELSVVHTRTDTRTPAHPTTGANPKYGTRAQAKPRIVARSSERTVIQPAHGPSLILRGPRERLEGGDPMVDELANQLQRAELGPDSLAPVPDMTKLMAGIDVSAAVRNKYKDDVIFRKVIQSPKNYKNFEATIDGLLYLKREGKRCLAIPDIAVKGEKLRKVLIKEAHITLAHLSALKTLELLRNSVWWPSMTNDVKDYCASCQKCAMSKPTNQKPYGMLNPPKIPSQPWEVIGIDFVGPLPESKNRDATYDSITVVIDLLTHLVHLIPSRITYTAKQVAELVFAEIYKHHGLPRKIISDRDKYFTSLFWEHLHKLIGTELGLSSAYHPQTDGSSERTIRTVEQMLRQCIQPDQKDWVQRLPAVEFAINCARSGVTGFSPFFLNSGRVPRTFVWEDNQPAGYAGVRAFAQRMKLALMQAHDCMIAARVKGTNDANKHRRPSPFREGDYAYISTANIRLAKGLARKLAPKFVGPYKIKRDFSNNSYQIELPTELRKRGIHDVFHASLLRTHQPNDDRLFPDRSLSRILADDEERREWEVEKVLAHAGSKENAIFQIRWKTGEISWLPYHQVAHLVAIADYLEAVGVSNIGALTEGNGSFPDDPQLFAGSLNLTDLKGQVGKDSLSDELTLGPSLLISAMEITTSGSTPVTQSSRDSTAPGQNGPVDNGINPSDRLVFGDLLNAASATGHFTIDLGNPIPGFASLYKLGWDVYVTCKPTTRETRTYHAAQVRAFIKFDAALRASERPTDLIMPAGYDEFALIINSESFSYRLHTRNMSGDWVTTGTKIPWELLHIDYPRSATIEDLDTVLNVIGTDAAGRINRRNLSIAQQAIFDGYHNHSTRNRRDRGEHDRGAGRGRGRRGRGYHPGSSTERLFA